ncbi:alpha/beta fold hydrolase [Glacieibacterium sp.]|uniref:alpha/beta fold hydrolase n=1 Tax=Glacieibacterium sp. TaxID=2860237 RepID=UPI003AFFE79E
MGRLRYGYADTNDGQVHYRRVDGPGDRPLVLLHQTASSGAMFELVMAGLAPERPSIAFDTPGFGNSFVPAGAVSLDYLAGCLVEALDALGVDRFDLCGHHTGGCIALEIAARVPGRVNSLGLIGPVVASPAERDAFRATFTTPFTLAADGSHLKVAWDYLASIGADSSPQLHQRELIDHLRGSETMPKAFAAVWDQDTSARLAAVTVPVLLMIANDDALYPIFHNATAARPDATVSIVDGMDFQPDRDPAGVVAGLSQFLAMAAPTAG